MFSIIFAHFPAANNYVFLPLLTPDLDGWVSINGIGIGRAPGERRRRRNFLANFELE